MATRGAARTPAQTFALAFGAIYLLIGVVGFAVTGFDDFAGKAVDEKLIAFPVNPLHNLVHIAIGAAWLVSARAHATAKTVNMAIGAAYILVFILGIVGALEWLAIKDAGSADNYLHLATGALAIYFGSVGAEGTTRAAAA